MLSAMPSLIAQRELTRPLIASTVPEHHHEQRYTRPT